MNPLAVILVTHNSLAEIGPCLDSLLQQDYGGLLEIVVVDNASTDATAHYLQRCYPEVRIIRETHNRGYGYAANVGITKTKSGLVMVANPDVVFGAESVRLLVESVMDNSNLFVTPKLLLPDGWINALGNTMHRSGITSCAHFREDSKNYSGSFSVPLLSGAVMLATRAAWIRVGGFDSEMFLYMEDAELSLRARLMGFDIVCCADAFVTHDYALRLSAPKFSWLERHRLWTMFKLLSIRDLIRIGPSLLVGSLLTWAFALLKGRHFIKARLMADIWFWGHLPKLLSSRRKLRGQLALPHQSLMAYLSGALPLAQLFSSESVTLLSPLMKIMLGQNDKSGFRGDKIRT